MNIVNRDIREPVDVLPKTQPQPSHQKRRHLTTDNQIIGTEPHPILATTHSNTRLSNSSNRPGVNIVNRDIGKLQPFG